MELIASTIVQGRMVVYILFAAMIVFCVLGLSKVQVNNDITAFLPSDIETRRGLTIMEDEFRHLLPYVRWYQISLSIKRMI